jgi:hypothetical protein
MVVGFSGKCGNFMWKYFAVLNVSILCAMSAEPFRKTLTSASDGVRVDEWEMTGKGLPKGASIQKRTLHGGKQEGVDVITVNNGKLTFTVVPTRGMSIAHVEMGAIRLGWDSPVKELVHPQYMNLESRGGLGWLEGFNEWMVRCGLEFAGHPGKDKFINNNGDEAEMDLTLHGKIGNIPASEVEVVIDGKRIRVRGRVDERMFYGPKLEMWTEISTEVGSNEFRIEDQIKNFGAFEQEYQLIYHVNFGAPLLEAGSKFAVALKQVTPFNANAAKGVKTFDQYAGPTKGFIEQVYCLRPLADSSGKTMIVLQNATGERGIAMKYSLAELPYLTLWKNTAAMEDGYVTGLEPGTGFPFNRRVERHFGRVPKIKPGETLTKAIDYAILADKAGVNGAMEKIRAIQGGAKAQVDAEPVALP